MDDVFHFDRRGNEVRHRDLVPIGRPVTPPCNAPILPSRILRCSNGHETAGECVQMIGDHSYCTRCMATMLDGFGARVRVGMDALNRPSGDRAASAIPPDTIVEWQPEIETQEMAILRAEVQWRSAQGAATRDRALCEAAHFGQEQSG